MTLTHPPAENAVVPAASARHAANIWRGSDVCVSTKQPRVTQARQHIYLPAAACPARHGLQLRRVQPASGTPISRQSNVTHNLRHTAQQPGSQFYYTAAASAQTPSNQTTFRRPRSPCVGVDFRLEERAQLFRPRQVIRCSEKARQLGEQACSQRAGPCERQPQEATECYTSHTCEDSWRGSHCQTREARVPPQQASNHRFVALGRRFT